MKNGIPKRGNGYNNLTIDINALEKHGWKLLENLFPFCIKEIKSYCKKEEIDFEDLEFDDKLLYDFFDKRNIFIFTSYSKVHKMFSCNIHGHEHKPSINNLVYFKGRYEADCCGIFSGMKKRNKMLQEYILERKLKNNGDI